MALKTKRVQMQSGAKKGLQCDGRHTAAHMLFKMIYYSSAVLICCFLNMLLAVCYLAVQLANSCVSHARYDVKPHRRYDNISIREAKCS